ncbi:NADH:flavin oxidoreductase [Streptomyces millisiae]|uniref:NADH:flavin oxidoreductase n=1 Tax=Streptomyces millisiae TaxID=3075542 RepID=A0ABU2LM69_9ACTN|nr:NADH:flavin oxidoreductase [Streptomyces sp. DSM 44918]MDT0318682.1 NADH:flavin oxidoreductase [Streptomyces sp. DSM 44918]
MGAGSETTVADPLFTPVPLGDVVLPNRVAVAPMTRISATDDGRVTDRNADYYARFARGGFSLVITEGIYPDAEYSQGYWNQPGLSTGAQAAAWRTVVDAVHRAGGAIIAQLMHAGGQSQGNRHRDRAVGPSAVAPRGHQLSFYRGSGPFRTPRMLSLEEIAEVRHGFVAAARRAVTAGFDGVEIHGANGYLIDQFLTDYTNQRADRYGGTVRNRVRLAAEICADVVQAVGSEVTVGIRISQAKVGDATHRWAGRSGDAETIFGVLGRTGVHYVHTTEPDATAPAFGDSPLTLAEHAKRHSGTSVLANGGLATPAAARSLITAGAADMVALGKPALADRDWVRAAREGRDPGSRSLTDLLAPLADIKDTELGGR